VPRPAFQRLLFRLPKDELLGEALASFGVENILAIETSPGRFDLFAPMNPDDPPAEIPVCGIVEPDGRVVFFASTDARGPVLTDGRTINGREANSKLKECVQ
jgi:hypothetical protein